MSINYSLVRRKYPYFNTRVAVLCRLRRGQRRRKLNAEKNVEHGGVDLREAFGRKRFEVEHAMALYADSWCHLPAESIYDRKALSGSREVIDKCHIYMIGFVPEIKIKAMRQDGDMLKLSVFLSGEPLEVEWLLPYGWILHQDDEYYHFSSPNGEKFGLSSEEIFKRVGESADGFSFKVKYIGQAFGSDGNRNALDRLLKHETFQKIAVLGAPSGFRLHILLLEVKTDTTLITTFNPWAVEKDDGARVKAGLEKVFGTSEQEQVALFEASFIRYFEPEFNKIFKYSFPSTTLNVLQDCYAKDFSALFSEISLEGIPFKLCSEKVESRWNHIAKHDLHRDADRRVFFFMDNPNDSQGPTLP